MKFSVPFSYNGKFVRKGKRSEESVRFERSVTVDITGVEGADAPVAFLVVDPSRPGEALEPNNGQARRVRRIEGQFWREAMTADELKELLAPRPGVVEKDGEDRWARMSAHNPFHGVSGGKGIVYPDRRISDEPDEFTREDVEKRVGPIRIWEDDGGEAMGMLVRHAALSSVVVDGMVLVKCAEPCWIVERLPDEAKVSLRLVDARSEAKWRAALNAGGGHSESETFHYPAKYTLDRLDDAVLCAREMAASGPRPVERVVVAAKARVIDPAAACFPDDVFAVQHAAELAVGHLAAFLPGARDDAAEAWIELREAMAASGGKVDVRVGDALGTVAKTWGAAVGWSDTRDLERTLPLYASSYARYSGGRRSPRAVIDACEIAHRRWERRPDDGREWIHLASGAPDTVHGSISVSEILTRWDARAAGRELGLDLDDEAAAADAGTARLLVARDGVRPVGVAVADPDGNVTRISGGKRTISPAIAAALRNHAMQAAMEAAVRAPSPMPGG